MIGIKNFQRWLVLATLAMCALSALAQTPVIGVAKSAFVSGSSVTFDFTLENLGDTALNQISVGENLNTTFGAGNWAIEIAPAISGGAGAIVINPDYNGSSETELLDPSSSLAIGQSSIISMSVHVIKLEDLGLGLGDYSNQVTATAVSPSLVLTSDLSDDGFDPDTNGNSNPDEAGENDPTLFSVAANPAIGLAKTATVIGRNVTFDFYLENIGNLDIVNVNVEDDLGATFGLDSWTVLQAPARVSGPNTLTYNGAYDGVDITMVSGGTLAAGATVRFSFMVETDPYSNIDGGNEGLYFNSASVVGDVVDLPSVSDISDWGTDPDPDGDGDAGGANEDDPTTFDVFEIARIGAAKLATLNGNEVTFDIYIENLGNSDLSSISLVDNLDSVFGAGNYTITSAPSFIVDPGTLTLNGAFDGSASTGLISSGTLNVEGDAQIRFVVDITSVTDRGAGLGVYSNQASISAIGEGGASTSDLSDAGSIPDPDASGNASDTGENDPTIFVIGESAIIGAAKEAVVNGTYVTLTYTLENFGNVTLSTLSLTDNLDDVFGIGNYSISAPPSFIVDPATLVLDSSFDGNSQTELLSSGTLAAGAVAQFQIEVKVIALSDQGFGYGNYANQVVVSASSANGQVTADSSDNGTEPDTNGNGYPNEPGENDATTFSVAELPSIGIAKSVLVLPSTTVNVDVSGVNQSGTGPKVRFIFSLENLGNVPLTNLSIQDDLLIVFGVGNFGTLNGSNPEVRSSPGTITVDTNYNGSTVTEMLNPSSSLNPGEVAEIVVELIVITVSDQGNGIGVYSNQATAQGDGPSATVNDLSDNGTHADSDGNGSAGDAEEDDPTVFSLGSYLGASQTTSINNDEITYNIYLENFGGNNYNFVHLYNELASVFGEGNYNFVSNPVFIDDPGTLTLNPSFDGSSDTDLLNGAGSLNAGDTAQIEFTIALTKLRNRGAGLGVYTSQSQVEGTQPGGLVSVDSSDNGTDPDPNGNDNPTDTNENDANTITMGIDTVVGAALNASPSGSLVTIDIYLRNYGGAIAPSLTLDHNLDNVFGAGNYTIATPPSFVDDPGTFTLDAAWDGSATTEMLSPGGNLASGDTAQIQLVVQVDNIVDQGYGEGTFQDQVTIYTVDARGIIVCDLSDGGTNPDSSGNSDPTTVGEDDPTGFNMSGAAIGLARRSTVAGTLITYDLFIENLGGTAITSMTLTDQLLTVFGFGNFAKSSGPTLIVNPGTITLNASFDGLFSPTVISSGTLAPGARAQIRYVINVTNVTNQGSGFGIYPYQSTISANDSQGNVLTDTSDDGILPDSNFNGTANEAGENDTTTSTIGEELAIGVAKEVIPSGLQVTFNFYLENLGSATANNVSLTDDLDSVFGAGNYSINSGPSFFDDPGTLTLNAGYDGSLLSDMISSGTLASGDTAGITVVIDVSAVINLGSYSNQAIVAADSGSTTYYADFSDDGTDPDPDGNGEPGSASEDDISDFNLASSSGGVAKTASVSGNLVTFNYYLENLGTSTLTNISLVDDLDAVFGAGNYTISSGPTLISEPRNLTVNPSFNGSGDQELVAGSIATGLTDQVRLVVNVHTLINSGSGYGVYANQVTLSADGGISDLSDSGTNPDPNSNGLANDAGEDDPTAFSIVPVTSIGAAKTVSVNGAQVTVEIYLENFGNMTLSNLSLPEDLDAVFGMDNYTLSSAPSFIDNPGTLTLNAGFDGSSTTELISAGTFATGDTASIRFVLDVLLVIDGGSGLGNYANQVTASAEGPDMSATSDLSDSGTDPDPNANGNPSNAGENDPTTFTLTPANIGDFVWQDLDGDGVQDGGEPGLSGVLVFADFNNNGTQDGIEPGDTTDGSGAYDILGLVAGSYNVRIDATTIAAGLIRTTAADPLAVTLTSGQDYNNADFGYQFQNAAIGDYVWNDLNGDGVQDGGEPGLSGVTVFIDSNSNGSVDGGEASTTTDGSGNYSFTGLPAGIYNVTVLTSSLPSGFVLTGGSNPNAVNLAASENNTSTDFGYQQQNASIGDFVWDDLDGDGVQDGGEPGISGVTVFLDLNTNGTLDGGEPSATTDGSGAYDITALATGTYSTRVDTSTLPSGAVLTGGTDPVSVTIAAGEDYNAADFGYQIQNASIGDFVWNDLNGDGVQDGGEPGLSGIVVYLDLNTNGSFDGGEPFDTTTGDGSYDITGLPAGSYSVAIDGSTVTSGFVLTSANLPLSVTLAVSEDYNSADFGYQQQDASIGDFVWDDLNGDGVQDGGEPGISGVTVFFDSNSNGALDGGEASTTTDGSGAYLFDSLPTGTYNVQVLTSSLASGYVLTGGTNPAVVILAAGEVYTTADFGYQKQDASIGDFVWNDLNGDGVQDGGEPGFSGVTVYLDLNVNGTLDGGEPSATTDASGAYDITNLATGNYTVRIDASTLPAGAVLTGGTDPVVVALAASEDYNNADFGYQIQNASIGDFVWNDLNGDGVQDGGEPGISGITVFLDLNTNGTLDGGEPSATTDGSGAYDLTGLAEGTYSVQIDGSTVTSGFVLTTANLPLSVTLAVSEDYNTADFGYQQQDASIGDFVWDDLNGDGVQDGGEPGISGATVFLDTNSNGTLDGGEASATTDGSGAYTISNLPTGTYNVTVLASSIASGYALTGGTNPAVVNLAAGEVNTATDFGFQKQDASIGDFVWNDLNGDGIQDGGEPGLVGITVYLDLNTNGTLDGGEPSSTTDAAGAYDITNLATGSYSVAIDASSLPGGAILTGGTDPVAVVLAVSEDYNSADFGYQVQNASIGDFVWDDLNGDGVQDVGEPGLAGITVFLDLNGDTKLTPGEPNAISAGDGSYVIGSLAAGTYTVRADGSTVPSGYLLTTHIPPLIVTLAVSEAYTTADFGYRQSNGHIGDFVWNDLNGDGVQDPGEPGLGSVTLYIDLNHSGGQDPGEPAITSNASGAYDLKNLAAGTYDVVVATPPIGYILTTGNQPLTVTITSGETYTDADFGYQRSNGAIGDLVWSDRNGNGVRDTGEPGLGSVTLEISQDINANGFRDADEPVLAVQTTTNGIGSYQFNDLTAGDYLVEVTDVGGVLTGYNLTAGPNPRPVTLAAGQIITSADFGYQRSDGSIGDLIFDDSNANGVFDVGEPGLAGVTLDLYDDLDLDGQIDPGEPLRDTQVSDANGNYYFEGLEIGRYIVQVTDTGGVLTNYALTSGTNPRPVNLAKGQHFAFADFGYCQPASITEDPEDQLACEGDTVTLTVTAEGSALHYQWRKDGTELAGETSDTLTLIDATTEDSGDYDCVVTGGCGSDVSLVATVQVDDLRVRFDPPVVVQGVNPVTLTAIMECGTDPYAFEWKNLTDNESIFFNQNPVTLPSVLTHTTLIRVTVKDHDNVLASAEVTVQVLSAIDPIFHDLNQDGCNLVDDVQWLAPEWQGQDYDANGDNKTNILDFIYIRVDPTCE